MINKAIDLSLVTEVAIGLKELKNQVVFIGGAITCLYADVIIDYEIRETKDIDLTIELTNYGKWVQLQERLSQLGFHPDPNGHAICSYLYKEIPIDIMSSEDGPLGPANKWYKLGFKEIWKVQIGDEEIQLFSAPCYLATKFEAYHDRGKDYRTSHDFEDIIYILDNRSSIVVEIKNSFPPIKLFLAQEFKNIVQSKYADEILSVHLSVFGQEERLLRLKEKISQIINL